MKYILSVLFCITAFYGNGQSPQVYTAFNGDAFNMYKWEGRKMVFLTQTDALNAAVMNRWVGKLDDAYDYYEAATGREPLKWHLTYLNERATVAFVNSTCGAGCGYLGATGIEMMQEYFSDLYNSAVIDEYNQIPFYELGRNFWFYEPKLNYKEIPNVYDPIATGFAVIMRFKSMEYTGVNGAPFGEMPFNEFTTSIKNILPTYLSDPTLTWHNTLAINEGIPSYRGAPDLFASFCFYLADNYGNHDWIQNVWKYAALRPDALTTQDAVDNFIIASSQAANQNLTTLFQSWRWPVSAEAIEELDIMFSVLPVIFSSISVERTCEQVHFKWTTMTEFSNKGFELQQSNDGILFEPLGFVEGTNTNSLKQYSFSGTNTSHNLLYYRIKQIDYDGKFVYSPIVQKISGCSKKLLIYPNPVSNTLYVKGLPENSEMQLADASGNIIRQWKAQNTVDMSGIVPGIYYLIIKGQVYKLIKQ